LADPGWPFELRRKVGEGTSSVVWLATARPSGRSVALKVGRGAAERTRLANEAERLCAVDSPYLSSLVAAGTVPQSPKAKLAELAGQPFIALSWHEGAPLALAEPRSAEQRLALAQAVARDIGEALADLHAAGFAHGDIKPANLLFEQATASRPMQVHLVDLGLSEAIATEPVIGATPRYLAPEALQAGPASNARARDLWALGLTLAEILEPELAQQQKVDTASVHLRSSSEAFNGLIHALLSPLPAARPSAHWVSTLARNLLAQPRSAAEQATRWRHCVKQSYLNTRSSELWRDTASTLSQVDVAGAPGDWLREATARVSAVRNLRAGRTAQGEANVITDLSPFDQRRWLCGLIGGNAAHFPSLPLQSDGALAERLWELAERRDPRSLSFSDIAGKASAGLPELQGRDLIALVSRLSRGDCSAPLLETAVALLDQAQTPASFKVAVAHALRRRGDWAAALLALEAVEDDVAVAEAAEICRRMGDRAGAMARLQRLTGHESNGQAEGRARATKARIELDGNDLSAAKLALQGGPELAASSEVLALVALKERDPARALEHAQAAVRLALDSEESARAQATLGLAQHASGNALLALEAFTRAAEHAVHAGALVEEATYASNVAAAAADLGQLATTLEYGQRGLLLFEHLGRTQDCARVALSLLCAHATVGAVAEALHWYDEVQRRARLARDDLCQAYAHLTLADLLIDTSSDAMEHATRAATLLANSSQDDNLRAASRLHLTGGEVQLGRFDAMARTEAISADAKLWWWGARAYREAVQPNAPDPGIARAILAEISQLVSLPVAVGCSGPSLGYAVRLARRAQEGDTARRLLQSGAVVLQQLERGTPAVYCTALRQLPWVQELQESSAQTALSREQIGHLEQLVRSLGIRDRLRPLLDQVLDALVLWTGVERGLVLLRAPGGRLVPRAARNLARSDIAGEQLKLSQSLAERALSSGEPVVAIDASFEMSELHQSVHALGLRSVLAVPLIARGEALGVVYLDDRTRRGAFGKSELSWVRLVATLAAVAIADARDQLLLRRAARSARHAKDRVLGLLSEREAQVDQLQQELAQHTERGTRFAYDAIVGRSEPLKATLRLVDRVASADVPVLILGESGTGKELIARAIHENSARRGEAFVTENCASIPETLLEATLFGHAKGAFTGAARARIGLFELAHRGTLFLDEVGEMSLGMQAKLLRAIDSGEIHPLGSEKPRMVDVRVLAATHRDLEQMALAGKFRKDLFYRLNVVAVRVPPLRERGDDIDLLISSFYRRHAPQRPLDLHPEARRALCAYGWPGNVRELENEVRRLLVMTDGRVELEQLSPLIAAAAGGKKPRHDLDLRGQLDALERALLSKALERTQGNQTRAAELLGISRFGLQKMLKRLEIEPLRAGREGAAGLTDAQ